MQLSDFREDDEDLENAGPAYGEFSRKKRGANLLKSNVTNQWIR